MPLERFEEQSLSKNPDLWFADMLFRLKESHNKDGDLEEFLEKIKEANMARFYEHACDVLKNKGLSLDAAVLASMKWENEKKLKELSAAIEDAQRNLGEIEVRDATMVKAEYYSEIGHREECLNLLQKLQTMKGVTLGYKLDIVFFKLRIGYFSNDLELVKRMLDQAQTLIDEGGDWDRRNRLKVYRGVYCMLIRDFKGATDNFIDSVATFTSYELMAYDEFVRYTVLCSVIVLDRPELRDKIVRGSEIQQVLQNDNMAMVRNFVQSLYNCEYDQFFALLAEVEQFMKSDWLLTQHFRYYVKEMRILAYSQLLQSYHSLTLQYMANAFGVDTDFIDKELSRFIAVGRLACKIDKVNNVVETTRPDRKSRLYQDTIKHGDALLNRIQKLSRVINL